METSSSVLFLHDPKILDEGELEAIKTETTWRVGESVLDVRPGDLVIARHTMWPWPLRVERDVVRQGGTLLNNRSAYVYADDPVSWSNDLGEMTPATYTDFSRLPTGCSFVVKGKKADKGSWRNMFAKDADEARKLLCFLNQRDPSQTYVAREYVPLERLQRDPATNRFDGPWTGSWCPASTEFRVWVLDEKVLSSGFYWPEGDCERSPSCMTPPREFLEEAARRVHRNSSLRWFTLDVALTETGRWIVVEVSDGQRAGLSSTNPVELYRNMVIPATRRPRP